MVTMSHNACTRIGMYFTQDIFVIKNKDRRSIFICWSERDEYAQAQEKTYNRKCICFSYIAHIPYICFTLVLFLCIQIVNGDKHAFVEFFAPCKNTATSCCAPCLLHCFPGCGHCKRLAPAYEEVGKAYDSSDEVVIAKVDCDAEKSLAKRFGVTGYPTLKFFPKGSTEPEV